MDNNTTISVFKNVQNSKVPIGVRSVDETLNFIKNNKAALEIRNSSNYDELKRQALAVTWCGNFKVRNLLEDSLLSLSGFMYFDIDDEEFDIELLYEIPHVYSCWKSLSGKGVGFIIKVNNLTTKNFRSTYEAFCNEYQLNYDTLPDYTRLNILSYDPNLHLNPNSDYFEAVESKNDLLVKIEKPLFDHNDEYKLNCAYKYVAETRGLSFTNGQRHNFTIAFFGLSNQLGVDLDKAYGYLYDRGCYSDVTYKKGKKIYKAYSGQFNTK